MFLSKYGVARHIYIPIVKRAVVDFAVGADWTPATGDVKISKDGVAANVTNLPTAIAMGNGAIWDFSLTATEMQAAQIVVTVVDAATKAVEDQSFIIETHGNASAQFQVDLADSVRAGLTALPNAAAEATGGLYTRGTGAGQVNQDANGRIDANVVTAAGTAWGSGAITAASIATDAITAAKIAADAIGASELAADAVTEIQTGLSTLTAAGVRSAVGLASANLDTQLAAVQADTDDIQTRLPAALVSGRIDASVGAMAANVLTATAIAADAITDAKVASDVTIASVTGAVGSVTGNVGGDVVGMVASVTGAVGSVLGLTVSNLDATISSRASSSALATVQSDTDDIQTRLPAALVSGRIDASVGAMAANVLTATAIAADAITDAKVASDVTIASVTGAVGSVTGAVGSVTGNVTGSVGSIAAGGITAASIAADAITAAKIADGAIDAATFAAGAINAAAIATDAITAAKIAADAIGASELAADAVAEIQSGLSTHSAADVWAAATRLLTAGTNIVLAKGVGVTGFTDLSAAQVNAEADTALADYDGPTHAEMTAELATADDATLAAIAALNNLSAAQVNAEVDTALADYDGPTHAELTAELATADDATLSAIAALNDLSEADVRTAVGLASANIDTQLGDLPTSVENAAGLLDLANGIETGVTLRQAQRIQLAVASGEATGLNGPDAEYFAPDGTTSRITGTVDGGAGTRSDVVLTP